MLYFAPINLLSNYVYRHIVLACGADRVFSELILVKELDKAIANDKLNLIAQDIPQTIFQIGVSSPEEVFQGVALVKEYVDEPLEININMGCPQSTMQQTKVCGGILYDIPLMGELANALSLALKNTTTIPSIKLRLGTDPDTILIDEYLEVIQSNGVKKVYIHARTLRYGYNKEARYEFFSDLRERYPDMTLVFNGDVDSYESYNKIGGGDVLIARAGLSNPFVFKDIQEAKPYGEGLYNPHMKDPYLIRSDIVRLSPQKIQIIREYLTCAIEHDLRKRLYCANMSWLMKGVSRGASFHRRLQETTTVGETIELFEKWLKEEAY